MAQTFYSLFKMRRGKDAERIGKRFEEGEPLFTSDTHRFFIGTGDAESTTETGGTIGGNLSFAFNSSQNPGANITERAVTGDILFTNNKTWRFDGAAWTDVSPKLGFALYYDSNNRIAVDNSQIRMTAGNGINIVGTTISIDATSDSGLKFDSSGSVYISGINGGMLNSVSFPDLKITGTTATLRLNSNYFTKVGEDYVVTRSRLGSPEDTVLTFDGSTTQYTTINGGITNRFSNNNSAQTGIGLTDDKTIGIIENITVKDLNDSSIVGLAMGVADIAAVSATDSLYNGSISEHFTDNAADVDDETILWPGEERSEVLLYDGNSETFTTDNAFTAKSAGFLILDNGVTETGKAYKRFAIPVYELPDGPEVDSTYSTRTALYCLNAKAVSVFYYENNEKVELSYTTSTASVQEDDGEGGTTTTTFTVLNLATAAPYDKVIYVTNIAGVASITFTAA